jgi:hypothetical protein
MPERPPSQETPAVLASDAERGDVVRILEHAMSEGRLTPVEAEERIETAYAARTMGELAVLTDGLPVSFGSSGPARQVPQRTIKLVGDVKLGGALAVGTVLHATAFFGDVVIDLSSATIPPEGVEIRASVGIGDVRVIVPDGATVKMRSFNVLGDRVEAVDPPLPSGPVVTVRGRAMVGDIEAYSVSHIPPGRLRRAWERLRGQN